MTERHSNPYSTHIPILIGISRIFNPKRVLEYGAGFYSTPLFVNPDVFPNVADFVSCETDRAWIQKVVYTLPTRDSMRVMNWFHLGNDVDPDDSFDLVFVDSESESSKLDIIRKCGRMRQGPVVIHDTDHAPYQKAVQDSFKGYYWFGQFNPNTTVAWNGDQRLEPLIQVSDILSSNRDQDPTDVAQWIKIFEVL